MDLNKENIKNGFLAIFKDKRELTFLLLGVLMLFVLVWYLVSNISFLVDSFNTAFNLSIKSSTASEKFNLNEAEEVLKQ